MHVWLKTYNKRLSEPAKTLFSLNTEGPLPTHHTNTAAATLISLLCNPLGPSGSPEALATTAQELFQ